MSHANAGEQTGMLAHASRVVRPWTAASGSGMTHHRPKLLLLRGPHVDADAVAPTLDDHFEVVEVSPDQAMGTIDSCQAVLAEAGDFVALERDLVGRQSSVLLNAISEGVGLSDRLGRVLWANDRFRSLERHVLDRIGEVCRHAFDAFEQVLERGDGDAGEPDLRAKKYRVSSRRDRAFFQVSVSPVLSSSDSGGANDHGSPTMRVAQVAAVVRDVSGKVRMERRLDAIERAGNELAHIDPEVVRSMHAQERLREVEQRVRQHMRELLHFDHFAIRMLDSSSGLLPVVMAQGMPDEAQEIELRAEQSGQGITGWVASTGRSYVCEDCEVDPLYVRGIDNPGSSLTVPLRAFDRKVGVLNIESHDKHAFSRTDRQFVEIFAGYLARALHTLNLLVVERASTSESASGVMSGEISGPLNDLCAEVAILRDEADGDDRFNSHLDRIMRDVDSIRRRVRNVARGPNTLLGVDEVLEEGRIDPSLAGKRVLVVDNEDEIREITRGVLSAVGCRVVTCDDGITAIRLMESWRAGNAAVEPFDLVLSDIGLGDASGYDVFAAARRASDTVPVILVTGFGYDPHHSIVRASQEGLQAVLFKPFQAAKLLDEVRQAVSGHDESDVDEPGEDDEDNG